MWPVSFAIQQQLFHPFDVYEINEIYILIVLLFKTIWVPSPFPLSPIHPRPPPPFLFCLAMVWDIIYILDSISFNLAPIFSLTLSEQFYSPTRVKFWWKLGHQSPPHWFSKWIQYHNIVGVSFFSSILNFEIIYF